MADIAPLKPLRYDPSLLREVVAPPYDVIDAALRSKLGARHSHNVVHIDLPEGEGEERYDNARQLFQQWQREATLVRDDQPSFWRYAQTFEPPGGGARLTRKGFFALVRAVPFSERVILPHERTLTGPKIDRLALTRATRATLSPQFMLYSDPGGALEAHLESGEPFADFSTDDGIRHQLWRIAAPGAIASIVGALGSSQLLIADGHHRYETAVMIAEELDRAAQQRGQTPSRRGEHLFTLALLANGDDPNLVVFPTHRLVHSLADFDFDGFLSRVSDLFAVEAVGGGPKDLAARLAEEKGPAVCAVGKGGRAAILSLRVDAELSRYPVLGKRPEVVRKTSVALLHDALLEHVLGISAQAQAAKTNIVYLQDAREGVEAIERGEAQALFLMNPTPISTIREVAAAGEVMPQKSTFFYPKVPTGLFFHTLDPEREVAAHPV
jgi:uncharacterized protein (DUF1015 family)